MRTGPAYPGDAGYVGLRMSADEYLSLGETPERYELIHGVVVGTVEVPIWHNEILAQVVSQSCAWSGDTGALRIFPSTPLRISAETVYRPDLCVYRAERLPPTAERLETPPDLVVEILAHDTRALDLFTKRDDYEAFGVGEYWTIDSETADAMARVRDGSRLAEIAPGNALRSRSIPRAVLNIDRIRTLARRQTRVRY